MIDAQEDVRTDTVEITFPAGLPGFPHSHIFQLAPWGMEGTPFSLMTSREDPDVGFVVVEPWVFYPEYEFELDKSTSERLALAEPGDSIVLCVVTLGEVAEEATVNLLGPIVVNRFTREACQAVLDPSVFEVKAPLARDVV
ncbi:MAG: flagellar assembly factor FliW [Actinomycetota bacterium]|jgi:flagellar assembly factor FliW|nr:flagellar assembly factor FliW [Actinomycetota bacterium]